MDTNDPRGKVRLGKLSIVLAVLLLVDGLLLATSTFTTAAKVAQVPLYASLCSILYLDNREHLRQSISNKVFFGSIFGVLAALTAIIVLGLTLH